MRNTPIWLRVVLGGVLTIALGVVGTIVGIRLAAPAEVVVSAQEAAQVATEVPEGLLPSDLADLTSETLAGIVPAEPVATTATIGYDEAGTAARVDALIDAVATADDPALVARTALGESSTEPPIDICFLEPGPGACPEGAIETTVLADGVDRLPQPWIYDAGPALEATDDLLGREVRGQNCLPALGGIVIAVVSNMPGRFLVHWASQTDPADAGEIFGTTDEDEVARWNAARAGLDPSSFDWPLVTTCLIVPATAGVAYDGHAEMRVNGPAPVLRDFVFNGDGSPTRPVGAITVAAEDIVIVTLPHVPGETTDVRWHVAEDPTDGMTCDSPSSPGVYHDVVSSLGPSRITPIDTDVLLARNERVEFSARATYAFALPEGITVTFCATVSDADGENYNISAIVQTADRLMPVIDIYRASIGRTDGHQVRVLGLLGNGVRCGNWTAGPRTVLNEPAALCDYNFLNGSPGATPSARLGDRLPVTTGARSTYTVVVDDDPTDEVQTRAVIDLERLSRCTASCLTQAPSYYLVSAPGGQTSDIIVRVRWTSGYTNGAADTVVLNAVDTAPAIGLVTTASAPRIEALNNGGRSARASMMLTTTGADHYRVRLFPAPGTGPACVVDGNPLTFEGDLALPGGGGQAPPVELVFDGLCAGSTYVTTVTLSGPSGSVVYGLDPVRAGQTDAYWAGDWYGSRIAVPRVEVRVLFTYELLDGAPPASGETPPILMTTRIAGDWMPVDYLNCFVPGNSYLTSVRYDLSMRLGENVDVSGSLQSTGPGSTCGALVTDTAAVPLPFTGSFTLTDLLDGDGVRLQIPPGAGVGGARPAGTLILVGSM